MKIPTLPSFLAGVLCASLLAPALALRTQETQPAAADMAEMMKMAKRYTEPGPAHENLERFIGKWDMEMRMTMGGKTMSGENGSAEFSWLMEGRWLKNEAKGSLMGMPIESFSIMGYDNFKHSYVSTMVSTMDTAMHSNEGDMDPSGKALLLYGTIDEYLTGEHDKMVKTVWRFLSDNEMIMEVHDLPIGEKNTKVIEVVYTRQK